MDILNDLNGNFIHFCVKKKYQIRAGDTDKAEIINPKKFSKLAYKISSSLNHIGNLDIDFMYRNKKAYVLDLNPDLEVVIHLLTSMVIIILKEFWKY